MTSNSHNPKENIEEESVFTKIIKRKIPADFLYEDERAIVIKDIEPQAPIHLLVIPKKQIVSLSYIDDEDIDLIGHLMKVVRDVAKEQNLQDGYRIVINNGSHARQEVLHLHIHILAGRQLSPKAC